MWRILTLHLVSEKKELPRKEAGKMGKDSAKRCSAQECVGADGAGGTYIEGVKGGLQQWRSTPISVPLKSSHGSEKVERRRGIKNYMRMRRGKAK